MTAKEERDAIVLPLLQKKTRKPRKRKPKDQVAKKQLVVEGK